MKAIVKGVIEMDADSYQTDAARTLPLGATDKENLMEGCMGLAGEAGEVCDHVKKHFFQGHELSREELKNELGDVMWYISQICTSQSISLSEIMRGNITKLRKRYPNGFTIEDSIARRDINE